MSAIDYRPWPTDPRYRAGSDGSIVGPSGRVLRPWVINGKYLQITTSRDGDRKAESVHVIVCESWHGPRPEGMEVAHRDGNGLDCRPGNLRWTTHLENCADKIKHGTYVCGEATHAAKLTEVKVRDIRKRFAKGETQQSVAARYGVTPQCIARIVHRETWRHVS